jgi:(p)ppGpp synthase/HD superfamily hydrolase
MSKTINLKLLGLKPATNPNEMFDIILLYAVAGHAGQLDKGGRAYIHHPLKVMYYLKTDDVELMAIAVGHDLIEDTDVTFEELRELGISERILAGLKALTKIKGESESEYMAKLKSNRDAAIVKYRGDLRHNTDIRRLKGIKKEDFARMQKYHGMYLELGEWLAKNP